MTGAADEGGHHLMAIAVGGRVVGEEGCEVAATTRKEMTIVIGVNQGDLHRE